MYLINIMILLLTDDVPTIIATIKLVLLVGIANTTPTPVSLLSLFLKVLLVLSPLLRL